MEDGTPETQAMPVDPIRVRDLFLSALERPAEERPGFLAEACHDDAALRAEVDRLLAANADPDSIFEPESQARTDATAAYEPAVRKPREMATEAYRPDGGTETVAGSGDPESTEAATSAATPPGATRVPADQATGMVIAGRYTLVEVIGQGGMGSVYRASQSQPVKRLVALKLIKTGMDSRDVLARFDAERQALALMDHPNIARIYDGGVTEAGQPFFVMELVDGVPLTEYCDRKRLGVRERLELFVSVCQAVQHAHQKGIIHRDLKPSNVLVTEVDGRATPKVIDFGVAKATEHKLTDLSFADTGALVGTPAYMSPEQADPSSMDIDTRTDVYALGVMLYELLTGSPPIDASQFKRGAILEMLRMVREVDPPRPSTKLSTADALPNIAANRSVEPARLAKLLQGELDWVVMKALEKDRTRRYDTANGFARDIQRYLADEVVEARPPSRGYRLRKFVRRNRPQVIAASLVLLALVAGVVGTTLGLLEAKRQERLAVAAAGEEKQAKQREAERAEGEKQAKELAEAKRREAEQQQKRAEAGEKLASERLVQVEAEKRRADEEKQVAQAVNDFLQMKLLAQADTTAQANQLLSAGRASGEAKYNPTIRELLDRAAQELATETIEANFPNQPRVQAEILRTVGNAYCGVGEAATAIPFLTRSVDLFKSKLGPDHPDTLESMGCLARGYHDAGQPNQALLLFEQTFKLTKAKHGPDHPLTLGTTVNLAGGYQAAGQLDKALLLLEETLTLMKARLGPDRPDTLLTMAMLAGVYLEAGQLDKALPLLEETLTLHKAKLGPDHPLTLLAMTKLAGGYRATGQMDKVLPLVEETFKLTKAKHGPDHPLTLRATANLAQVYQTAGKLDQAQPLVEETIKLMMTKLGPDHPDTLLSMSILAGSYYAAGKLVQALPVLEETFKLTKAKLGPDHPDTLVSMNNLTVGYRAAGQLNKALPLCEETLQLHKAKLGPDHPLTLTSMANLAAFYRDAGKLDQALPLLEETHKLMKTKLGPDHPDTLRSMNNLAMGYQDAGKLDQALPLFEETLQRAKAKLGPDHPLTRTMESNLTLPRQLLNADERYRRELAANGPNHINTLLALRDVAQFHMAIGQLDRGEQQLGEVLAGLTAWGPDDPIRAFTVDLVRRCLFIREKTQPEAWTTFNTQSMLGGALLGQKKYAEAEPLLVKGYEGMKAREQTIPKGGETRIPEALDRLIELYTALERPDEVEKWRAERAKYPEAALAPEDRK